MRSLFRCRVLTSFRRSLFRRVVFSLLCCWQLMGCDGGDTPCEHSSLVVWCSCLRLFSRLPYLESACPRGSDIAIANLMDAWSIRHKVESLTLDFSLSILYCYLSVHTFLDSCAPVAPFNNGPPKCLSLSMPVPLQSAQLARCFPCNAEMRRRSR